VLRGLFIALSHSRGLQRVVLSHPVLRRAARRFVAGEQLDEALDAIRALEASGLTATLDLLGEGVDSVELAEASGREYLDVVDALHASGVASHVSVKLTQLGLDLDPARCADLLRQILDRAGGTFVRIDMESSAYVDRTLDVLDRLWAAGYRNVGTVIQSYLYRSDADVERLIAMGARVRLVKGAYLEPATVAYRRKADVDASFARLAEALLTRGAYPALATHDERLIEGARRVATSRGIAPDRFEFQMLYGIRRDLQTTLHRQGYGVRVYVPFGGQWYPYYMRRLAERPANAMFVLRSLLLERRVPGNGANPPTSP